MKKKFGKKEAGGIALNSSVIMIVSIVAVTLFIGTAMQPVIAISDSTASLNAKKELAEEEHLYCDCVKQISEDTGCKTCVEAVFYAVNFMKDHVKDSFKDKGVYFLWTADLALVIVEGLVLGIQDSGFKIKIDQNELKNTVNYWINKLYGPQMFFVTRFMARLGAIYIGITWYLLSFCVYTNT